MRKTLVFLLFVASIVVASSTWKTVSLTRITTSSTTPTVITSLPGRYEVSALASAPFYFRIGSTTIDTTHAPVIGFHINIASDVPIVVQGYQATVSVGVTQYAP